MVSPDDAADRLASGQMNAELRLAQLEILSAQCATDRLRLRYSADDLARHAQRDILRKAWSSANALFEYYDAIVHQLPDRDATDKSTAMTLEEAKILDLGERLARHILEQREHFRAIAQPLEAGQRAALLPFFPGSLLAQARLVVLATERIPRPPLDLEARAMGMAALADLAHPSSATFEDVLVFHREVTVQRLFHALVHAVQFEVLGLEPYAERFVRGFLRTRSHASVPLEVHASMLEMAFTDKTQTFSVEEKVRLWTNQGRY
ncbi:MAG: hypothetical protein WCA58_17065 [Terriglobales bacterium]